MLGNADVFTLQCAKRMTLSCCDPIDEDRDVSLTPHETRPQQETTEVFGEPKKEKEEVEEKVKEREEKGHSRSIDKVSMCLWWMF